MKNVSSWFFKTVVGPKWTGKFAFWLIYKLGKNPLELAYNKIGVLNYQNTTLSGEKYALTNVIKPSLSKYKRELIVFDVGANLGSYTKLLNNVFGSGVNIFSFEPNPHSYKDLIKINPNSYNIALGNESGKLKMYGYEDDLRSSRFTSTKNFLNKGKEQYSEIVEVTTLSKFVKENEITHIDFLKIDTEGNDYDVLKGIEYELLGSIPFIQFEINQAILEKRILVKDFYELLSEQFDLYRMNTEGLINISEYFYGNEIFLYQNILAINKNHSNKSDFLDKSLNKENALGKVST